MEWLTILEKGICCGLAAMGFAVLFNVPVRALFPIFLMGALGGLTKFTIVHFNNNTIEGSLAGSTIIGFISIPFAHYKHAPPPIFSIPAVIPMVPGIFAYRMMLGLISLAGDLDKESYQNVLSDTVNYGLKVMFILMSLAIGVGLPMLITRKDSAKEIRFKRSGKTLK